MLRALFGPPVEITGLDELARDGFVVRPTLRTVPVPDPGFDLTLAWHDLEEALVASPVRNRLILSEVGCGLPEAHFLVVRQVCTNGMLGITNVVTSVGGVRILGAASGHGRFDRPARAPSGID